MYYEWTKFYFESLNDMTCPSSRYTGYTVCNEFVRK